MTSNAAPRPSAIRIRTGLLTATGLLAGTVFVSPLCYWQGRTFRVGSRYADILPNWQPDLAPGYGVMFAVGLVWVVTWFLHARRIWRGGRSKAHALLPAATFAFSAILLSYSSMACGAY